MAMNLDDFRGPECKRCGKSLEGRRSDTQYCCAKCYRDDYHQLDKDARLAAKANRPPCRICGKSIPASAISTRLVCSRTCQKASELMVARRRFRGTCIKCGDEFTTSHAEQRFCSHSCHITAEWQKRKCHQAKGVSVDIA